MNVIMKLFKYLLLLTPVLFLVSCLHEEEDIFGEIPAIRMQKAIAEYKSLLTDAPNGWILNYYPELKYGIGGFAIHLKFTANNKSVDAACEVATNVSPFEIATSEWDVIPYQGPVLTFDTYNEVIHYFSEVTGSSDRDGRAGDYDLVIMKAVKDTFYLSGLKNENKMVMWKCPTDPIEYLRQVNAFAVNANKFKTFNILQNGDSIGTLQMSSTITNALLNRTCAINFTNSNGTDTTVTVPFYYTPEALRLQTPFEIKGATLTDFSWDKENSRYAATGTNIVLQYVGAKIYEYEDFLGNYKLSYSTSNATPPNRTRSLDVTLVQETLGESYRLEGLLANGSPGKLIVSYTNGKIEVKGQIMSVDPNTNYDFWLLPYSYNIDGNYTSRSTDYGLIADKIEEVGGKLQFDMVDNKVWTSHGGTAGFLLRNYNGSTSMGNVTGKDGQAFYYFWRFEKQ
jgi:hypothetical protein